MPARRQLDILAIEPFFGGHRRSMLETLAHCSAHRWTIHRLPARRMERRLLVAANWFAEALKVNPPGRVDVLFTSEAINLAELRRLVPAVSACPSVAYFHDNQLPSDESRRPAPSDAVNLTTAAAASEVWFNTPFHLQCFLRRASALVSRHPELAPSNPLAQIIRRCHVVPPPMPVISQPDPPPRRAKRRVLVDLRHADTALLTAGLATLVRRGQSFELVTIGPRGQLPEALPLTPLSEHDTAAQLDALHSTGVYLSADFGCLCDPLAVAAFRCGARVVLPDAACHRDLLPADLAPWCLYDYDPESMASRMQDVWALPRPDGYDDAVAELLAPFTPVDACAAIDARLADLAALPR